ncbi:MAG: T9SS type A sorting domain-containing protein [Bacteroidales bacterium]|jgi:hypothetical protein|nr:T9SS type A sorting domain-containing protein [Bacteroidales bacterium]
MKNIIKNIGVSLLFCCLFVPQISAQQWQARHFYFEEITLDTNTKTLWAMIHRAQNQYIDTVSFFYLNDTMANYREVRIILVLRGEDISPLVRFDTSITIPTKYQFPFDLSIELRWDTNAVPNIVRAMWCDDQFFPYGRTRFHIAGDDYPYNDILEVSANDVQLYPNPASSQLKIKNYQLKDGETVEIIDVLGRVQQSSIVNQQSEIILDVSHLSQGMYFIKIGNWRGKFVKQ